MTGWPLPVLPAEPTPAPRAPILAPLEGERLLSTWRLFSASVCCSPASTLDEILRKSLLFIHFNFLPSPVAAHNGHELRDLLRAVLFLFSWQTTFTGAVLPMGSHWHMSSERTGGVEQLENAPLCTFLTAQQQGYLTGRASQPSCGGVLASHPPVLRVRPPTGLCNSAQKSQGDLGVKAETTASKSVLEECHRTSLQEGSPPFSARSRHKGKRPEDIKYSLQIQAEGVRVLWGHPLHCKKRD